MQRYIGRAFKSDVPETPELHRVLDLPRRVWEDNPNIESFCDAVTQYLKTPGGTQRLRPVQAIALQEINDCGGMFGSIPVGEGKTLISFLAPVVLNSKRPLLVVPARLRAKTTREFILLEQHWQSNPKLEIVSYEKLSREGGTTFLQAYKPDLLIFDETHKLKNRSAAVTRRISAWMKTFPETRVIAMSGTATKRSLLDFAHALRWALPDCCPLPAPTQELESWAAAVDEIKTHEARASTGPGALLVMCNAQEKQQGREGVRSALRRRLQETPGVVACHSKQLVDTSLNISLFLEDGYNDRIRELAARLNEGYLPNGEIFIVEGAPDSLTALQSRWRIMRTLTSGFWYRWEPQPPADWLALRASWKKVVRRLLEEHLSGMESEALVTRAAQQGRLGLAACDLYQSWAAVKDAHKWKVVPVWEDDCIIHRVKDWAKSHQGLIWVSEVALGDKLQEALGLPYFRTMGLDDMGRAVESMRPSDGSIVVSVASNSEGRNLQAWNENLVISPPPTGTVWEQMIGRTHRQGQQADEVWVDVVVGCKVEAQCWEQAVKDARYASAVEGPKKLNYATIDHTFSVPSPDGSLW
jgi:hypothetical protein